MKFLILARHNGLGGGPRSEVVTVFDGATLEQAQEKARQIHSLNKGMFEGLEVKLFGGDYYEVPVVPETAGGVRQPSADLPEVLG